MKTYSRNADNAHQLAFPSHGSRPTDRFTNAFSRTELLTVIGLLALLIVPLAAHQRTLGTRTDELLCMANLRHVGHAFQVWAGDHDDKNPCLVETKDGGIRGVALANNLWYQFAWISNELVTPKVLACPSDTNGTRVAQDFSTGPAGGFLHASYRNNALSYFLAFHVFPDDPGAILAGDRNVVATSAGGCSYAGLSFVLGIDASSSYRGWTNLLHGTHGNILLSDGSAQATSNFGLKNLLQSRNSDNQATHFLAPR